MSTRSALCVKGTVSVYINNKLVHKDRNLVTDTGLHLFAERITNTSNDVITHMAIGKSNIAPKSNQTQLIDEVFRKELTNNNGSVVDNKLIFECTFGESEPNLPENSTCLLNEIGLYTNNLTNPIIARAILDTVPKTNEDVMTVRWEMELLGQA